MKKNIVYMFADQLSACALRLYPLQMNNLADDPASESVFQGLEKTLAEKLAGRDDTFCACRDLRHWFDSERRVIANAYGPLSHPEAEPDWALL